MFQKRIVLDICLGLFVAGTLHAVVVDLTGDTGTAQIGAVIISGGGSGLTFDSDSGAVTGAINYVNLPPTDATDGQILIGGEPVLHRAGGASQNIFVGGSAGNFTLTGAENVGVGASALNVITSGTQNTAVGDGALIALSDGGGNTAVGAESLSTIASGNGNTAIGQGAGSAYSTDESNNIIIGNNPGAQGESSVIRIGDGHSECYISGIYGAPVSAETGTGVFVDPNGKLGTIVSSDKFKRRIRNIGDDSSRIMRLRPVKFYFRGDATETIQYGLIAEEVFDVVPELVIKDNGVPNSVKAHLLVFLLLNEVQKMNKRIQRLEAECEQN